MDNTIIIAFETHDDNLLNVNTENSNKYGDLAVAISHSLIFFNILEASRLQEVRVFRDLGGALSVGVYVSVIEAAYPCECGCRGEWWACGWVCW